MLRGSKNSENSWEQSCQLRYTKTRGYTRAIPYLKWGTGNPWGHSICAEAKPFRPHLSQHDPQCSEGTDDPLSHGSVHFPWYLRHILYSVHHQEEPRTDPPAAMTLFQSTN